MNFNLKYLIILIFLLLINMAVVSAEEFNSTDVMDINCEDEVEINQEDLKQGVGFDDGSQLEVNESLNEVLSMDGSDENDNNLMLAASESHVSDVQGNSSGDKNSSAQKPTPVITINSKNVVSKNSLKITLKNSSGSILKNKKLTAFINNKKYSLKTNSKGIATLPVNLAAKSYNLKISFGGDSTYGNVSKDFIIKVSKIKTMVVPLNNFVIRGGHLYFYVYTQKLTKLPGKKITIIFKGKKYVKTLNKHGYVKVKTSLPKAKHSVKVVFKGDKFYSSSSKLLKFNVVNSMSFRIGNSKLIPTGFLRVYLSNHHTSVANKKITVYIDGKKLSKRTSSEGIAIFKPKVALGSYMVKAVYGGSVICKRLICHEGSLKSPLKSKIPMVNGAPDVDVMPSNYVMANEDGKYTLTKSQYREVIQRDSHCLYLNKKLSKYTFFKTKKHPKLNHIIKRGKWNVIEREINKALVSANKHNYWPSSITVSLRGKAFVYSEVRDPQDTDYTCGPASASVCSQALRNYYAESYLAKLSHSKPYEGTSCTNMKNALEKHNFDCSFYYRSTLGTAVKEIKKGGCALIFHAYNHYVSVIDISKDGKKFLVSNSYGSFDNIKTGWVKISYMKTRYYKNYDDGLIIKLNYKISKSGKNKLDCFYKSMGTNWSRQNTQHTICKVL